MKAKTQRMIFIVIGLSAMFAAATFITVNFRDNLVFFYTPTEFAHKSQPAGKIFRIGGLVVEQNIKKDGDITEFTLTDTNNEVRIRFRGILPPLFRGGQGIVAQGGMGADNVFIADNLLAKHDEKYMPPEVAEALKKSGNWHPEKFK